jgi:predicted transcriptional regulator
MILNDGRAMPTHVQRYSRLSYDKMMIRFLELERKGMLQRHNNGLVSISSKCRLYLRHYEELTVFIDVVNVNDTHST